MRAGENFFLRKFSTIPLTMFAHFARSLRSWNDKIKIGGSTKAGICPWDAPFPVRRSGRSRWRACGRCSTWRRRSCCTWSCCSRPVNGQMLTEWMSTMWYIKICLHKQLNSVTQHRPTPIRDNPIVVARHYFVVLCKCLYPFKFLGIWLPRSASRQHNCKLVGSFIPMELTVKCN
jgi:hypothetical protein